MPLSYQVPAQTFLGATAGYARNDVLANGMWVRNAIMRQIEHLLTRHPTVLPGKNLAGRTIRNSSSSLRLWSTRIRAPLEYNELVVDVQLLPTDTTAGSPRWWIEVDGVSAGDQYHTVRCASGSGTQFSDIFEMQQIVPLPAPSQIERRIDLYTDDNCRVAGWDMHLRPRDRLYTGSSSDTLVDYTYALPLSPVRDDTIDDIGLIDTVWRESRGYHVNWNVDDPATPVAVSSTSATDLWGGTGVGPTAPTQYRNSYANENLLRAIANKSIPMVCWVLGERTAGAGNVIVRFISDNHPGGVDVTINGALSMGYRTTSFTLLPQAAGDCIRIQYLVSAGGTTGNIYAVGCFPLVS